MIADRETQGNTYQGLIVCAAGALYMSACVLHIRR
jgi:hypothetical protein